MKHTKQCPKCGSTDIICFPNSGFPADSAHGILPGLTIMSCVQVHRYICCSCGFTEEWVNKNSIETLKQSKKAKPVKE